MRRLALLIPLIAIGALGGMALVTPDAPKESAPAARVVARASGTEAAAAAMDYLAALRWDVVVDEAKRRRVLDERATVTGSARLERQLAGVADGLRAATRRPPVVASTAILGYRVRTASPTRASVRVWGMAVFGSRSYSPATQWSTSDLELLLEDDRWLVNSIESSGGPSPDDPIGTLAVRTRGLKEVRHVP